MIRKVVKGLFGRIKSYEMEGGDMTVNVNLKRVDDPTVDYDRALVENQRNAISAYSAQCKRYQKKISSLMDRLDTEQESTPAPRRETCLWMLSNDRTKRNTECGRDDVLVFAKGNAARGMSAEVSFCPFCGRAIESTRTITSAG